MGLLNVLSNWREGRHEKHLIKMASLGRCPDCHGRGRIVSASMDYPMSYNCSGCNGTGTYSDWKNNQ